MGAERHDRFFRGRVGAAEKNAADTDSKWLQKWIAIGETIGISKKDILEGYYLDEFLTVLDMYNEIQSLDKKKETVEVSADAW